MPDHLVRRRAARYPPIADDMTATRTRYIPLAFLNVAAETPVSDHGDTDERPSPAPKAKRANESAAAATAPAAMLAQHRVGGSWTTTTVSARDTASMGCCSGHCKPRYQL